MVRSLQLSSGKWSARYVVEFERRHTKYLGPNRQTQVGLRSRLALSPNQKRYAPLAQDARRRRAGVPACRFGRLPAARWCSITSSFQNVGAGCPKNRQAGTPAQVRLRRRWVGAVEVRSHAVENRVVSNRNCVAATRGGEQWNENDQSVTNVLPGRRTP